MLSAKLPRPSFRHGVQKREHAASLLLTLPSRPSESRGGQQRGQRSPAPSHARHDRRLVSPAAAAADAGGAAVAMVEQAAASAFEELAAGTARKYIMVSGKGGVGKTSLSASLAVRLAQAGHTTLVVSTDPAHSLSDSLAQDVSGGLPVAVEGTDLPLWGMEIDPEQAKAEFRQFNEGSSAAGGGGASGGGNKVMEFMGGIGLGMIAEQLADLKLGELLNTPPPGLDEAVAISKVVQFVQDAKYAKFSRIVFDTAPTGHTLRLLALPDFVEASLGKIIRLRKKLGSATSAVRSLFGAGGQQDEAVVKLEQLKERITMVKRLFRDSASTEFIIATIPTVLGVNESSRLQAALDREGIPCKRIVVNQVIGPNQGAAFIAMKLKDQAKSVAMIESDPDLVDLVKVKAPLVDLEVRGVPALTYFGGVVWQDVFSHLVSTNSSANGGSSSSGSNGGAARGGPAAVSGATTPSSSSSSGGGAMVATAASGRRKFFMLGGKGGVGKTSCAASLAVRCAAEGEPTLVVSTDPAHSLSDAFDQNLSGGRPVRIASPQMGGAGGDDLPLWGMEVELDQARQELRELTAGDGGKQLNDFLNSLGMSGLSDQLADLNLGELLDTPPPGVDEAVAISKVVQFLKAEEYSKFTRIIFDTAPTGHTLRLLSLPDFLDASIGKLVRLRQRLTAATSAVTSIFSGGAKAEKDPAVDKLEQLKARMDEAKALFRDKARTQFIIVTIPTVMAVSESARLAKALRTEGIAVGTMVINQMVAEGAAESFLQTRRADQQRALQRLRQDPNLSKLQVILGPLFDLEVRGLAALQYFGSVVWK